MRSKSSIASASESFSGSASSKSSLTAEPISRRAGWFLSAAGQLEDRDHLVVGISEPRDPHAFELGDSALIREIRVAIAHDLQLDARVREFGDLSIEVVCSERCQRPLGLARIVRDSEQEKPRVVAGVEDPATWCRFSLETEGRLVEVARDVEVG